jgi:hypothetical protein
MRVVALIDHDRQPEVVEKILKHCKLWREPGQRAPPTAASAPLTPEQVLDYGFFDATCI